MFLLCVRNLVEKHDLNLEQKAYIVTPNVLSKSSILKHCKVQTWDLKYEIQFNKYSL